MLSLFSKYERNTSHSTAQEHIKALCLQSTVLESILCLQSLPIVNLGNESRKMLPINHLGAGRRALSRHEQRKTCALLSHAVCVQSTLLTSEALLVPHYRVVLSIALPS